MAEQQSRWGILGTAQISNKIAVAVSKSNNSKIVAVASRTQEKAEKFAQQYNIPTSYGGYDKLLEDKDVDVVYIPLPTKMKTEWAIKAAKAKKSVVIEKPLPTYEEAQEIDKACTENGVWWMSGSHFPHNPIVAKMEAALPTIGTVNHINVNIHTICAEGNIRLNADLEPAGCLGDLGWYGIKAILVMYGWQLPSKVSATATWSVPNDTNSVPTFVSSLMQFKDSTATMVCSFTTMRCQEVDVQGTKGRLTWNDFVKGQPKDAPEEASLKPSFRLHSSAYSSTEQEITIDLPQDVLMVQAMGAIKDTAGGRKWAEQGIKAQQVQDAILRAAKSGVWENV
eukprot:TRINITY_DN112390_c0_g1_i1.p1 TRINITY_DN112390_c0_g1~~TRINITY_DN112390_c0_g1_i1.p1  ORF type:complete len:339 (-),score=51.13 TRINITY_DN112390_c0_g1_i1:834-1850(-)